MKKRILGPGPRRSGFSKMNFSSVCPRFLKINRSRSGPRFLNFFVSRPLGFRPPIPGYSGRTVVRLYSVRLYTVRQLQNKSNYRKKWLWLMIYRSLYNGNKTEEPNNWIQNRHKSPYEQVRWFSYGQMMLNHNQCTLKWSFMTIWAHEKGWKFKTKLYFGPKLMFSIQWCLNCKLHKFFT